MSPRLTKWLTLAVWLALAAVLFPLAAKLTGPEKNDATAWLPRSAEATQALARAEQAFPHSQNLVAVVAYVDDAGISPADRAKVDTDRAGFARYAVAGQIGPAVASADGKALL